MRRILSFAMLLTASAILISCNGDGAVNTVKNAASNNAAPANAPAANHEADVKKLIGDLSAALSKNDAAALDKIYSDDYVLVMQDGNVATKAERLAAIKSGELKFENVAFSDIKVRSYGDAAVALASSSGKSTNKGTTVETPYRITFVAAKTKDGWRLVSAHLAPLPAAAKTDDKKPADNSKTDKPEDAEKSDDSGADKKTDDK